MDKNEESVEIDFVACITSTPIRQNGKKRGRPYGSKTCNLNSSSICSPPPNKRTLRPIMNLDDITSTECCLQLCLAKLGKGHRETVKKARNNFKKMKMREQTAWLFSYIRDHTECTTGLITFIVGTSVVCIGAFRSVHGISEGRLKDIIRKHKNGQVELAVKASRELEVTMMAREWLTDYADKCADRMPDTGKMHLPSCLTRACVYEMYNSDISARTHKALSVSHFMKIWRDDYNNLTIPKVNRFAKCDICQEVNDLIKKARTPEEKAAALQYKMEHLKQQKLERLKYYKHRKKAESNSSKYLSIIIDGMDQEKTSLPHFLGITKSSSGMYKLKMHLDGVIVHGQGIYGFFDYGQFPHASNMTVTALLDVIYMYRDSLPPTLYLQMDNCYRENKNKYVFAFCCLLVELKVFKKIKISFLMVGHTHEDIDQLFSRFSKRLSWNEAKTIPQLMDHFEQCYTPKPTAITTNRIFEISEWLSPHIAEIRNHCKPHVFKITLNEDGKAFIQTKQWSTDKEWSLCEGANKGVLLQDIPSGMPKLSKPEKFTKNVDLDKLKVDHRRTGAKRMTTEENKWWDTFFEEVEEMLEDMEDQDRNSESEWRLPAIVASNEIRPGSSQERSEIEVQLPKRLLKAQEDIPPVIIGPKQKRKVISPLAVGDMCLLDLLEYSGELQIAKVLATDGDNVTIQWYQGNITTKIKPFVGLKKGKGKVTWEQTVKRNTIWHHGFTLTKSGFLPTEVRHLIEEFENY